MTIFDNFQNRGYPIIICAVACTLQECQTSLKLFLTTTARTRSKHGVLENIIYMNVPGGAQNPLIEGRKAEFFRKAHRSLTGRPPGQSAPDIMSFVVV